MVIDRSRLFPTIFLFYVIQIQKIQMLHRVLIVSRDSHLLHRQLTILYKYFAIKKILLK